MEDLAQAAEKVAGLMKTLTTTGGLRLKYRITAGAGAADPDHMERRDLYVELKGPDARLMTDRGGEVLRALEHIAAKVLRLEPEDHDRISFDADGFKAARASELRQMAEVGMQRVHDSGQPFSFAPMSSRERRMLHLALRDEEDFRTESSGEGPRRFVVLYPKNWRNDERATAIRDRFRRR